MEPHTGAYGLTQTPPASSYRQLPSGHLLRLRGSHRSRVLCLQKTGWAENSRALGSWCTIWERRHRLGVGSSSFWISSEFLAQWGRVARGQRETLSYRAPSCQALRAVYNKASHFMKVGNSRPRDNFLSSSRTDRKTQQLFLEKQQFLH